ncbi:MAG TPA: DUF222 domain-containing protein [Acidimicrobiales bacterium]|nr:DUF222 domain-containing protein [Acidimicrobiales bacterium]
MIDELVEADPASFANGESMETLQRQLARLEAFATRAGAAFDASGTWGLDGAFNAATWLATRCRLPKAQARRLVRRGRALTHLPAWARAWSDGAITGAHVDAVSAVRRPANEAALARDEALLVDQAETLRFESFARAVAYWEQLADPDGTEADAEARRTRRDVYLEASFCGTYLGQVTLDAVSGAIVSGELGRLERELFEADWALARNALGREPTPTDLARNAGQRRADALVEMATRSATAPADGRRPAPLFSVLVDYPTLFGRVCELAEGTVVSPGCLLPWLDGPTWSGWCSDPTAGSRSAPPPGCSAGRPAGPSSCGTGLAPTRTATGRRPSARPTTSFPGSPAVPPPRRTGGCSAPSTTDCGTSRRAPRLNCSGRPGTGGRGDI